MALVQFTLNMMAGNSFNGSIGEIGIRSESEAVTGRLLQAFKKDLAKDEDVIVYYGGFIDKYDARILISSSAPFSVARTSLNEFGTEAPHDTNEGVEVLKVVSEDHFMIVNVKITVEEDKLEEFVTRSF